MKCRITFQGGHGMNEDAGDRFASIVVDVPDTIAKMCNEFGASFSHVVATEVATEWIKDGGGTDGSI